MEANNELLDVLNSQQVMMLRLLKTPLPETDFIQIRKLAVQLLAKQLDDKLMNWEEQKNITTETYNELNNQHFRSSKKNV